MLKKITLAATSLALAFAISACGKKNVKITLGKNPSDNRLAAFQGDWQTDQCLPLAGGYGMQEILISGNEAQFVETFDVCGQDREPDYGDIVTIQAVDNNKATIVDEYGNNHTLTISNGQITDSLSGRTFIKK